MTHKNDGFIENLMKVPAPLNLSPYFPLSPCFSLSLLLSVFSIDHYT